MDVRDGVTDDGLFRRVVEASRDGLWVLDTAGLTVYANPRMAALVGRTPEEMFGLQAADCLGPERRPRLLRYLSELAAAPDDDEGGDNREVQLVRPDGSTVWVLASHSPIRDDDGRRIGWVHRVTEHTEQKQLLESVRERERLLATAQSIARIGSWEWDVASDVVTWSDQLYEIYNVTPEEFEATYQGFLSFIHPDDRAMVEASVGRIFAGEDEFAWDGRVIPRGGTVRWVRGLGRVERDADGNPARMGGTAQDITERVTADTLAAEATRRLNLLQTMATAANQTNSLEEAMELAAVGLPLYTGWRPVGVYTVDGTGATRQVRFEGKDVPWVMAPDPALALRVRDSRAVEAAPAPGLEETHTLVGIPVLLEGEVTCVIEVLADEVPLDENSQALIEQVSQQLSQVAQREASATQLALARDEAMEASRLKSRFLATMSHEIRTPMNGVIGLNDLLLRTDLDAHQRRLADGVQGAGLTLLGIINDVLDLSKVEAGRLELERIDFDVRAVFEKTADVLSGPAHDKGIELVVACHPDVPLFLCGDPGRFGQVLANLGSNAVKFTDSGEVAIRAHVEPSADDEVVLRVSVTDTGAGIEEAHLPSLFDAFTQADPSTTREHGGTGLGLAISRELVHALGGTLEVRSTPGEGSTFTFTARFGLPGPARLRRVFSVDPHLLRGRRVLVVDDNETNRLILQEQLTAWRMDPVVTSTAEEALSAVRTATAAATPFDVVLLDLLLPDGDGLALARAISAGTPEATPTLLLLSSGHHVDLAAVHAAGISKSLTKPVRHSELFESLRHAVSGDAAAPEDASAGPAAGAGLRVLVVEDNPVNQMVTTGILESSGYTVDVVDDGFKAVAAVSDGHGYAAVLMDCQMPRMDGYDATRSIREREAAGTRVPIIAVTASALEGEEERCRDAGMDDFLTKPIDPDRLLRTVRRLGGAADPAPAPPATRDSAPRSPVDSAAAGHAAFDLERMRMLDEMRRDGTSLFERAAVRMVSGAPDGAGEIRGAVTAGDPAGLVAAAHRLKGSATNLGLRALGEAAAALEALGQTGTTDGAEALLGALDRAVDEALAGLAEIQRHGL